MLDSPQIEELSEFIESKLQELDAEKAELAAFQVLDRQRRSIEYALFDKELTEARAKAAKVRARAHTSGCVVGRGRAGHAMDGEGRGLQGRGAAGDALLAGRRPSARCARPRQVDAERAKVSEDTAAAREAAAAARERLRTLDADIAAAKEEAAAAARARKALAKERDAALKRRTQLELDEKEAASKVAAGVVARGAHVPETHNAAISCTLAGGRVLLACPQRDVCRQLLLHDATTRSADSEASRTASAELAKLQKEIAAAEERVRTATKVLEDKQQHEKQVRQAAGDRGFAWVQSCSAVAAPLACHPAAARCCVRTTAAQPDVCAPRRPNAFHPPSGRRPAERQPDPPAGADVEAGPVRPVQLPG